MANPTKTKEERLLEISLRIDNSLSNAEILGLVSEYGYTETKLNEGKALYEATNTLFIKQKTEYAEQYAATIAVDEKWKTAHAAYMKQVKVARVALQKDTGAYLKLGLVGARKEAIAGWLLQTSQFYTNALADSGILTKLAEYGITQTKLEEAKALVDEVEAANVEQQKEIGEAQQATLDRNTKYGELTEWDSKYVAIARIALEERPQLLEELGILERS